MEKKYFSLNNYLLFITNAAITPGTQPINVRINTINTDPQPLSRTANGGKIIHKITRPSDIKIPYKVLIMKTQNYKFIFKFPIIFVITFRIINN